MTTITILVATLSAIASGLFIVIALATLVFFIIETSQGYCFEHSGMLIRCIIGGVVTFIVATMLFGGYHQPIFIVVLVAILSAILTGILFLISHFRDKKISKFSEKERQNNCENWDYSNEVFCEMLKIYGFKLSGFSSLNDTKLVCTKDDFPSEKIEIHRYENTTYAIYYQQDRVKKFEDLTKLFIEIS